MIEMILPQPAEPFEWVQTAAGLALVCPPLETAARHVFTTRVWTLGSADPGADESAWNQVAAAVGVAQDRLLRVHQVHGARVVVQRADEPMLFGIDADILATGASECGLAVQTADCIPLLVADRRTGAVAAAHAGWRGIALAVPRAAVRALAGAFGSRATDLIAAVGPSIGPCCYEVGPDVLRRFESESFSPEALGRWFSLEPASTTHSGTKGTLRHPRVGHAFLDLWTATRDQLVAEEVPADQIHVAALCTASHAGAFCSYRRDGSSAGRMAAAIRPRT